MARRYIYSCAARSSVPLIGNGDVFSYEDAEAALSASGGVSAVMVARGALIKPWIFTEIKEKRHWDISATERFELLQKFTRYGLEHWGTDDLGLARTRNFLLEWLSFLHRCASLRCSAVQVAQGLFYLSLLLITASSRGRYVPVGLLERLPAKVQERPPPFCGRSELETLMASPNAEDWVSLSERLLGKVPENFTFTPKHKSHAYETGPVVAEG